MNRLTALIILCLPFLLGSCSTNRSLFKQGQMHKSAGSTESNFDILIPTTQSSNLIFVKVEIGGKEYRFLFDTGAPMVISKELQEEFQFKVISQNLVYDSQNQSQMQNYVQMDSLYLASVLFTDLIAVEADLRYSPILACLNIDGIIGANLMRHTYWEMDASTGFLRMTSTKQHWPRGNLKLHTKPFKIKRTYTPVIDLQVANTLYPNITFDTGSSDLLSLGRESNKDYCADSIMFKAYGYLSAGLFGSIVDTVESQALAIYLDSFAYSGPIEFEAHKDARLLGMSFLRHFRIFMDWQEQEIHFLPHDTINFWEDKSYPTSPFVSGEAIIVGQLNSLAFADGQNIALGDTIESINGTTIYPAAADTYCEVIQLFKKEESLNLLIRRKGEILIRRQDLFPSMNLTKRL
jgi:predicted aspartyl protease